MNAPVSGPQRTTICYPLAGDSLGGSHHSLLGLLKLIDRERFRLVVVVENADGRLAEHFDGFEQKVDPAAPRRSFEAGRSFGPLKFATTLTGLVKRARFLREQGVSIVHTNDGRSHATWALVAKLAGCKLVWHHRADPSARGLRLLAPWVADGIVTVSRFSLPRSRFSRAARDAKVVFSPFQTDISADRPVMRQRIIKELGLAEDTVICGYFGSFIARKRPLLFIDAVARLRARIGRPVVGLMFGEATHPELEAEMQQRIAQGGLEKDIRIMGYRSPGWEWIAGCDILMVPAFGEPLGRTLVEAMLVGTPVVATRAGGNPEALGEDFGILVPADDADALADGCARVVADPQATAAMVARAQADARVRFAESNHVAAITAIYDELLGASKE